MVLVGESFPDAKAQVAAEVTCEPRMLLKTIRALTGPRGFESHALRPTPERRAVGDRRQTVLDGLPTPAGWKVGVRVAPSALVKCSKQQLTGPL